MKTVSIRIFLMLIISVSLFACKKDRKINLPPNDVMALDIIHAWPSEEKLDVFFNNSPSKFNFKDFAYTHSFGYPQALAGDKKISINKKGSTTALLSETFPFVKGKAYSLFIIGNPADVKFLLIKDEFISLPAGKAGIRFVNLSPDAPALNLSIAGATKEIVITNKAYKEYSGFEVIDPAEKVTFNIKNHATGMVETSLVEKIEAGKSYTIYVRGLKANPTGAFALGASILSN
nr:DUF4397 domain-containing protein [Pedobacter sp. ASV2]